ncbi:unnamed protein product, partial [Brugia timori]|uniref:EGF-like domain-containing protein n=1 Tax=Brugia timori TaxID=42155 RepID=A0A0R3QS64_9BILA
GSNCKIAEIGCHRSSCSHSRICSNGGTCVDSFQGFRCLCPPCFYGESCLHLQSECQPLQHYNRTRTFVVKIENEQQNDRNSRILSKYSEQKPCLSICTNLDAEINYFERDVTNKIQTISGKKKLAAHPGCEHLDYNERYAIEPTVNMMLPSLKNVGCCNKVVDIRHSKRFEHSPLPTQLCEDGGSYYEEIDGELSIPEVISQQTNNESQSNIVNRRVTPDNNSRQVQDIIHKVTDIQTNL